MSGMFQQITCAVYVNSVDIESKLRNALTKSEKLESVEYFTDEEAFKEHIKKNNINIAICDVDLDKAEMKNKMEREKLPRELISYKKGTYFIFIVPLLDFTLATTLYRLGCSCVISDATKHELLKVEIDRAIEHTLSWKTVFSQLVENKSAQREFDELFGDILSQADED